ncbi:MAG TPA: hypothetical protein O0X39_04295 [Methanocorpusculum sp.]|nr:hypothetical protein [Methanocorpusculum sp.]
MTADKILGTWHGSKNIPFLASGKIQVTFLDDYSGTAVGQVHALGNDYNFDERFTWKDSGGGNYIGCYEKYQMGFMLNSAGTQVQAVVNAYRLGLMPSAFNQDITITLYK